MASPLREDVASDDSFGEVGPGQADGRSTMDVDHEAVCFQRGCTCFREHQERCPPDFHGYCFRFARGKCERGAACEYAHFTCPRTGCPCLRRHTTSGQPSAFPPAPPREARSAVELPTQKANYEELLRAVTAERNRKFADKLPQREMAALLRDLKQDLGTLSALVSGAEAHGVRLSRRDATLLKAFMRCAKDRFSPRLPERYELLPAVLQILARPVSLVTSANGSEASSQIPLALLKALGAPETEGDSTVTLPPERVRRGLVIVCQPTELAAKMSQELTLAEWKRGSDAATETVDEHPSIVYIDSGSTVPPPGARVVFCSARTLLLWVLRVNQAGVGGSGTSRIPPEVGVLIIDKVHERTVEIDLVLAVARRHVAGGGTSGCSRVVLMSATLDADELSAYFQEGIPGQAAVSAGDTMEVSFMEVMLRHHHIQDMYVEDKHAPTTHGLEPRTVRRVQELLQNAQLHSSLRFKNKPGDVIVFVPNDAYVERVGAALRRASLDAAQDPGATGTVLVEVLELTSDVAAGTRGHVLDQLMGQRGTEQHICRVIVTTSAFEKSFTFPHAMAVIDTGLTEAVTVDPLSGLHIRRTQPVSQAAAIQRAGRVGRTNKGVVMRMYSEAAFHALPPYITPGVLTASLDKLVLSMISLGIQEAELPCAPSALGLDKARETLLRLGMVEHYRGNLAISTVGFQVLKWGISSPAAAIVVKALGVTPEQPSRTSMPHFIAQAAVVAAIVATGAKLVADPDKLLQHGGFTSAAGPSVLDGGDLHWQRAAFLFALARLGRGEAELLHAIGVREAVLYTVLAKVQAIARGLREWGSEQSIAAAGILEATAAAAPGPPGAATGGSLSIRLGDREATCLQRCIVGAFEQNMALASSVPQAGYHCCSLNMRLLPAESVSTVHFGAEPRQHVVYSHIVSDAAGRVALRGITPVPRSMQPRGAHQAACMETTIDRAVLNAPPHFQDCQVPLSEALVEAVSQSHELLALEAVTGAAVIPSPHLVRWGDATEAEAQVSRPLTVVSRAECHEDVVQRLNTLLSNKLRDMALASAPLQVPKRGIDLQLGPGITPSSVLCPGEFDSVIVHNVPSVLLAGGADAPAAVLHFDWYNAEHVCGLLDIAGIAATPVLHGPSERSADGMLCSGWIRFASPAIARQVRQHLQGCRPDLARLREAMARSAEAEQVSEAEEAILRTQQALPGGADAVELQVAAFPGLAAGASGQGLNAIEPQKNVLRVHWLQRSKEGSRHAAMVVMFDEAAAASLKAFIDRKPADGPFAGVTAEVDVEKNNTLNLRGLQDTWEASILTQRMQETIIEHFRDAEAGGDIPLIKYVVVHQNRRRLLLEPNLLDCYQQAGQELADLLSEQLYGEPHRVQVHAEAVSGHKQKAITTELLLPSVHTDQDPHEALQALLDGLGGAAACPANLATFHGTRKPFLQPHDPHLLQLPMAAWHALRYSAWPIVGRVLQAEARAGHAASISIGPALHAATAAAATQSTITITIQHPDVHEQDVIAKNLAASFEPVQVRPKHRTHAAGGEAVAAAGAGDAADARDAASTVWQPEWQHGPALFRAVLEHSSTLRVLGRNQAALLPVDGGRSHLLYVMRPQRQRCLASLDAHLRTFHDEANAGRKLVAFLPGISASGQEVRTALAALPGVIYRAVGRGIKLRGPLGSLAAAIKVLAKATCADDDDDWECPACMEEKAKLVAQGVDIVQMTGCGHRMCALCLAEQLLHGCEKHSRQPLQCCVWGCSSAVCAVDLVAAGAALDSTELQKRAEVQAGMHVAMHVVPPDFKGWDDVDAAVAADVPADHGGQSWMERHWTTCPHCSHSIRMESVPRSCQVPCPNCTKCFCPICVDPQVEGHEVLTCPARAKLSLAELEEIAARDGSGETGTTTCPSCGQHALCHSRQSAKIICSCGVKYCNRCRAYWHTRSLPVYNHLARNCGPDGDWWRHTNPEGWVQPDPDVPMELPKNIPPEWDQ